MGSRRSAPHVAALAVLVVAGLTANAHGAVIEKWQRHISIAADGSVDDHQAIVVLMEDSADLSTWGVYALPVDEHREVIDSEAFVVSPEGNRRKLKRGERDEAQASGSSVLYSSTSYLIFEPDDLSVGSRLDVRAHTRIEPYFPAGVVSLRPSDDEVRHIDIKVTSAESPLRFDLRRDVAEAAWIDLESTAQSITISGSLPAAIDDLGLAASEPSRLYYSWSASHSWQDVGDWFGGLVAAVDDNSTAVRQHALQVGGADSAPTHEKLDRIVEEVRRRIRYVAVEVGIGGYQPSPPGEVLERKWGDCKDKSLLLIEMLGAVGIPAYPALVRLDSGGRMPTALPSHVGFNHVIVAVPTDDLDIEPADPVAEGLLFIDPTQTSGSSTYLHRGVQDQASLVVTGDGSRLVRIPDRASSENQRLEIDLKVAASGDAAGNLVLHLEGDTGSSLAQWMETSKEIEITSSLRRILSGWFPTADLDEVTWSASTDGLPAVEVRSQIRLPAFVQGLDNGRASTRLPGPKALPSPTDLKVSEGRPVKLSARGAHARYTLRMDPSFCPVKARHADTSNAAGSFQEAITTTGGIVTVERHSTLDRGWHEGDELEELRQLALAENKALKRRLRFSCPE